jgi:hypothetical protein
MLGSIATFVLTLVAKSWQIGKTMAKPWQNRGKLAKPWQNHGKTMAKPWQNHGKFNRLPLRALFSTA